MTTEELLALTPAQEKAWKRIEAGVKAFERSGGKFYVCLSTPDCKNEAFNVFQNCKKSEVKG